MIKRIKRLLSITAIRLSLVYTVIFGLLAVLIIFYMTGASVQIFARETHTAIDREMVSIQRVYQRGGINRLIRLLEMKARSPDANIYVVANEEGDIVAGNVYSIDVRAISRTGWSHRPITYHRFPEDENSDEDDKRGRAHKAVARVMKLGDGLSILVGRDIHEQENFRSVVRRMLLFTFAAMLGLAIFTWLFVGRRALKRLELMSRSTDRILGGDREERLPVIGNRDEFDTLSERLNAMLDRIFKLDVGLKQVSDNIAHDLRTPITRLRNKIEEGLSANQSKEDYRQTMEEVLNDCDGVIRTFDALLMISRVESGSSVASLKPQDLTQIVDEVAELYEPMAEDEGFEFKVDAAPGITVNGNRELLGQAISNLIDNAIKYGITQESNDKSKISVVLLSKNDNAIISVQDNGPGIPADKQAEVFERFTRLEDSRNQPGNGLGLSLVKAVAQLHGGKVELLNKNAGLEIEMVLPISAQKPSVGP